MNARWPTPVLWSRFHLKAAPAPTLEHKILNRKKIRGLSNKFFLCVGGALGNPLKTLSDIGIIHDFPHLAFLDIGLI